MAKKDSFSYLKTLKELWTVKLKYYRMSRIDFILFTVISYAIVVGAVAVMMSLYTIVNFLVANISADNDVAVVFNILAMIVLVPVLFVFVCSRWLSRIGRLHDVGHSAWLLLLSLIPYVGQIMLIYFLLSRGEEGKNKYDPPKGKAKKTVSTRYSGTIFDEDYIEEHDDVGVDEFDVVDEDEEVEDDEIDEVDDDMDDDEDEDDEDDEDDDDIPEAIDYEDTARRIVKICNKVTRFIMSNNSDNPYAQIAAVGAGTFLYQYAIKLMQKRLKSEYPNKADYNKEYDLMIEKFAEEFLVKVDDVKTGINKISLKELKEAIVSLEDNGLYPATDSMREIEQIVKNA